MVEGDLGEVRSATEPTVSLAEAVGECLTHPHLCQCRASLPVSTMLQAQQYQVTQKGLYYACHYTHTQLVGK